MVKSSMAFVGKRNRVVVAFNHFKDSFLYDLLDGRYPPNELGRTMKPREFFNIQVNKAVLRIVLVSSVEYGSRTRCSKYIEC